jgi:predicted nuclease of predicted toxin-antitoxin system
MKLLLDNNLSPRLKAALKQVNASIEHVSEVGLVTSSDEEVWNYAKEHNYTIVTKDSDFNDLSVWRGFPPKVVWLRLGNCSTEQIVSLIKSQQTIIEHFIVDAELGILCLK